MEFIARNYNQLSAQVYRALLADGRSASSRNGDVLRLPGVTTLIVSRPWERVNTDPLRDANPFFHLMEAMCMLAPLNDAELIAHFAKNMLSYSDDGKTFNAFYGTRLLAHREVGNQLDTIIDILRKDPDSRQCVAQIWDPTDLSKSTKDKACNLMALFDIQSGRLHMTTFNRSNDAIWGILTGANVVHFSFFMEYVACALDLPMGLWTHVSNNLHVYTGNDKWPHLATREEPAPDHYETDDQVQKLFTGDHKAFRTALIGTLSGIKWAAQNHVTACYRRDLFGPQDFLEHTVVPMFNVWQLHRGGFPLEILVKDINQIVSPDWRAASLRWISTRPRHVIDTIHKAI